MNNKGLLRNSKLLPHEKQSWVRVGAVVVMFVLLISVSFALFQYQLKRTLEQEIDLYSNQVSRRSAVVLRQEVISDFSMLKSIAVTLGGVEKLDVDFWIKKLNNEGLFSRFQRIGFILPNKKGYAEGVDGVDLSDREYAIRSLDGFNAVSDLLVDKITGKSIIFYSVPIRKDRKVIAAVSFGTFASEYEHTLDLSSYGQGDYSFVVDSKGGIILRSTHKDLSGNKTSLFSVAPLTDATRASVLDDMASGRTATFGFTDNGVEKHVVYTPVNIKDWYLVTIIPDKLIVEQSNSIKNLSMMLGALLTAIGLGFGGYIYRKQRIHQTALQTLAYVDPLTDGSNKNGFMLEARNILAHRKGTYALVIIDIDNFKLVNDIFGYDQGDDFLKHIASIIGGQLRPNEAFGRINADRFDAILRFKNEVDFGLHLENILNQIAEFEFPDSATIHLVVNAGVYIIENDEYSLESMSDKASLALDKARRAGHSGYIVYDDSIREELVLLSELEADIDSALMNNEFFVVIQPKYDINTYKIVGGEALVRWNHPKRGLVGPDTFIPLMEETGKITQLDMFVLAETCKVQQYLATVVDEPLPISVNQSRRHLYDSNYIPHLLEVLSSHGVSPGLIELELTESVFLEDTRELIDVSKAMRDNGFKISIDDFGSGYSSLNMLKDVTVDVLKLDKVFLDEAADRERGKDIVTCVVAMSKKLSITTVAEGVETIEHVEFLKEIGCDFAQGYYFSKPISVDEFKCIAGAPCH